MKRFFFLIQHAFKKFQLKRLYKKYVQDNAKVKADVETTFSVRGCKAAHSSVEKKFYHLMLYYPSFAFIFFWRIKKQNSVIGSKFSTKYHCKIFGSTKIDGGLHCFHPYATVINATSIGENFQFRNGLTIGNKGNNNNDLPIIGNNVTVGAQVVIIGAIEIGDNVTIGAGAVVVKSVPSNVVVAGNPAKIIKHIDIPTT